VQVIEVVSSHILKARPPKPVGLGSFHISERETNSNGIGVNDESVTDFLAQILGRTNGARVPESHRDKVCRVTLLHSKRLEIAKIDKVLKNITVICHSNSRELSCRSEEETDRIGHESTAIFLSPTNAEIGVA